MVTNVSLLQLSRHVNKLAILAQLGSNQFESKGQSERITNNDNKRLRNRHGMKIEER